MTMTEKYKILGKYIKDISSETKDVETYLYVRDRITKYKLGIDIKSKPLKNKLIEVNTILKFQDALNGLKRSLEGMDQKEIDYFGGNQKVDKIFDYITS